MRILFGGSCLRILFVVGGSCYEDLVWRRILFGGGSCYEDLVMRRIFYEDLVRRILL